jgi:uncharacterized protein YuzE
MDPAIVAEVRRLVPSLVRLPSYMEVTYDEPADVLYVSFEHGAEADDSELTDDDVLLRFRAGTLVGITFRNASRRSSLPLPN